VKSTKAYDRGSVPYMLASYFAAKLKETHPTYKFRSEDYLQKWARSADLMIRRDKISPEEIMEMIDAVMIDSFWCKNILSVPKLRKQFPRLKIQLIDSKDPLEKKLDSYLKELSSLGLSKERLLSLSSIMPQFWDDNFANPISMSPTYQKGLWVTFSAALCLDSILSGDDLEALLSCYSGFLINNYQGERDKISIWDFVTKNLWLIFLGYRYNKNSSDWDRFWDIANKYRFCA